MRGGWVLVAAALAAAWIGFRSPARVPGWNEPRDRYLYGSGWAVTPHGETAALPGDMPGTIVVDPDGTAAWVNTCGFHDPSLNRVNLRTMTVERSVAVPRTWMGLARSGNELLLSGGKGDGTEKFPDLVRFRTDAELSAFGGWRLPNLGPDDRFVSAILAVPDGWLVANIQSDEVLRLNAAGEVQRRRKVGYRPVALALGPQGTLAVTCWGDRSVVLLDAESLDTRRTVRTEALPGAAVAHPDGRFFVACSGSDAVLSIPPRGSVRRIVTGVRATRRIGATPSALALSPLGDRLYVANSGNNCVTVVDVSRGDRERRLGLIPTLRYPSALAVTPDGRSILVGTAKGFYGPNAPVTHLDAPGIRGKDYENPFLYIGNQMQGALTRIPVPTPEELARLTQQVENNVSPGLRAPELTNEDRARAVDLRQIEHVIYVIRENRTYDQVLGDLPQGNGDPSLTIFGRRVTPNGHALAEQFVLFDNFFTDGEVSQVGHQWSTAAYANDYAEKQWPLGYSGRGQVRSDRRLTSSPGEYLWTLARKHGKWARVYGEYVDIQEDHGSLEDPAVKADPEKFGYSESFERIFARGGRDPEKVQDFLRELAVAEKSGKWPALMVMALPEDHTHGFSAGQHSPYAMIGSNDQAVGMLVEGVSRSRFWPRTAIFIVQDDSQAGPDHVDSRRTVALIASPFARRGVVDSTMYSTASMIRTMELILGLPPMTQFDAQATPMLRAFQSVPDLRPFRRLAPRVDLEERNPAKTALAHRSRRLDFSEVDRADMDALNRLLWDGYRPGVPYPGSR